jgi:hypothetical protein
MSSNILIALKEKRMIVAEQNSMCQVRKSMYQVNIWIRCDILRIYRYMESEYLC